MVYYERIRDWVLKSQFPDRESVETYVAIHGGTSSGMNDTLDFLFGKKGNIPQQQEPVSPLEELQGIREPTSIQELQQEKVIEDTREQLSQDEGIAPNTQQAEQQETIIRRLRRFLGSIFGS